MPKFKSPFAQLPSAPPPGSSHYISNAIILAKRVALGLEKPVRITSLQGECSFDAWFKRHSEANIISMQLRREQKAPFFHQYITIRLDTGKYYRIDRRQLPNEESPLDCTTNQGVEAYDTIEEITSLEDSMYSRSDCLVQVDFTIGAGLRLIVGICREISLDKGADVYTVQRYNCYFYAQTILLCTICGFSHSEDTNKTHMGLWPSFQEVFNFPGYQLPFDSGITIQILGGRIVQYMFNLGQLDPRLPIPSRSSFRRAWAQVVENKYQDGRSKVMQTANMPDLLYYLLALIRAHSLRVEQYKIVLGCSAEEVEYDIKRKMDLIWFTFRGRITKSEPPSSLTSTKFKGTRTKRTPPRSQSNKSNEENEANETNETNINIASDSCPVWVYYFTRLAVLVASFAWLWMSFNQ